MKTPIRNFAHALTDEDFDQIFSLYPPSDFEQDVRNYEARKSDADPAVPVHYFRISRIMRDLLFTCSSINFGSEISRQSKEEDDNFAGVRLYDLNQSMLTPMFRGAGMPWLGTVHGSDLDYLYNNLFPKDHMSEDDRQLSDHLQASFINFAYTGNPSEGTAFGGPSLWPGSFPDAGDFSADAGTSGQRQVELQIIGVPLRTGSCHLSSGPDESINIEEQEASMQSPLGENIQYGEMGSEITQERQRALDHEKLIQRCAFVNSLAEKLGH